MAHALESCKDLKNIVLIWNLVKKAKTMNVFGCALQHLGLVAPKYPCPTHELIRAGLSCSRRPSCWSFRTPLAGCGAHAGVPSPGVSVRVGEYI